METKPQLKVSSDRLVKLGIESATLGLQSKGFIHYTTAAPILLKMNIEHLFFKLHLYKLGNLTNSISI